MVSVSKNNTPALRFDGFDGEWNVISLSDNATFSRGKGYSKADVGTGSYPLFLYGQLYTNYSTEIRSITTFSQMNDDSVVSTGREVLMPASDVTPTNIVRASHLKVPGVLLGGDLNVITPGDGIDPTYLALALTWGSGRAELLNNIQGATVKHLHLGPIRNLKLVVPSVKEQRAIGELFADLDALIEQHRAKHENLQQTKTALMQRMFPQDGSNEPELRLGGFSGAWEPRIMRDCAEYSKGNGYSKKDIADEGTPVIHYGRLYTNYETAITDVDTFASPQPGTLISRGDEVLVPASGETAEDIAIASALLQSGVLIGGDLNVIRPRQNIDSVFLALSLSDGMAKETLVKRAQGKSVVHLRNSDIQEVEILFPSLEEQRAIGEVFSNLDALITSEHRYITQLTQAKTALLQRMFV